MWDDSYWGELEQSLEVLCRQGFVKLPSISMLDLDEIAQPILADMGADNFVESGCDHTSLLEMLGVTTILAPKLYELAKSRFAYSGDLKDQYHIARRVEPGNSTEQYRAHFDSHLFTLVIPLQIPQSADGNAGQLLFSPQARRAPRFEVGNVMSKLYYKRYASKLGMQQYEQRYGLLQEDFLDFSPLLFLGNTTFHTNKPVSNSCPKTRLTLLSHFFDPSPKWGVGAFARRLRNR